MMQDNLVKLLQNAIVSHHAASDLLARLAAGAGGVRPAAGVHLSRAPGRPDAQGAQAARAGAHGGDDRHPDGDAVGLGRAPAQGLRAPRSTRRERLEAKARELMAVSLRHNLVGRWFQMLMKLFEDLGPALVYGCGGWLVIQRRDLRSAPSSPSSRCSRSSTRRRPTWPACTSTSSLRTRYFDRIFAVLDLEPAIRNAPDADPAARGERRGHLRRTSRSPTAPSEPLLRDIDLDIAPGECVAIVGPSGAGKSTLAALVPRLYDPTAGRGPASTGTTSATLELKSLRSHIGIVTQETYLFHASILENLRYARPDATPEEVDAGGARGADPRLHRRAPGRLRHHRRRTRLPPLGRRAAAARHRAGVLKDRRS